jgi:hypothetical protein
MSDETAAPEGWTSLGWREAERWQNVACGAAFDCGALQAALDRHEEQAVALDAALTTGDESVPVVAKEMAWLRQRVRELEAPTLLSRFNLSGDEVSLWTTDFQPRTVGQQEHIYARADHRHEAPPARPMGMNALSVEGLPVDHNRAIEHGDVHVLGRFDDAPGRAVLRREWSEELSPVENIVAAIHSARGLGFDVRFVELGVDRYAQLAADPAMGLADRPRARGQRRRVELSSVMVGPLGGDALRVFGVNIVANANVAGREALVEAPGVAQRVPYDPADPHGSLREAIDAAAEQGLGPVTILLSPLNWRLAAAEAERHRWPLFRDSRPLGSSGDNPMPVDMERQPDGTYRGTLPTDPTARYVAPRINMRADARLLPGEATVLGGGAGEQRVVIRNIAYEVDEPEKP